MKTLVTSGYSCLLFALKLIFMNCAIAPLQKLSYGEPTKAIGVGFPFVWFADTGLTRHLELYPGHFLLNIFFYFLILILFTRMGFSVKRKQVYLLMVAFLICYLALLLGTHSLIITDYDFEYRFSWYDMSFFYLP